MPEEQQTTPPAQEEAAAAPVMTATMDAPADDAAHDQDDHAAHDAHAMMLSDTTTLFGRELPYPIYTLVFFALGVLTLTEVILAELLMDVEVVKVPVLLGIATAKALLVVIFYMHLNTDSRVFALTLFIPVGIALLSTLFLLSVPHSASY